MSRYGWKLFFLPLLTLPTILTGCEWAPPFLDSNSAQWAPAQFPESSDVTLAVPFGPHDVQMSIDSALTATDVTGYLDMSADGTCSLHLVAEEKHVEGGHANSLEIVKIGADPAYSMMNDEGWGDMRDPATPTLESMELAHPLGGALSAENRYQSLCFLYALPAMLTSGEEEGEFLWDSRNLEQFADASYDSFVAMVLKEVTTSQEEYDRLVQTVSELGSRPTLAFAEHAGPLEVWRSSSGASVLTFSAGDDDVHKVTIVLTPSQARKLEYPKNGKPLEEHLAKSRHSEDGVRSVLGQYFAVK